MNLTDESRNMIAEIANDYGKSHDEITNMLIKDGYERDRSNNQMVKELSSNEEEFVRTCSNCRHIDIDCEKLGCCDLTYSLWEAK